jgi:hypothetical protein
LLTIPEEPEPGLAGAAPRERYRRAFNARVQALAEDAAMALVLEQRLAAAGEDVAALQLWAIEALHRLRPKDALLRPAHFAPAAPADSFADAVRGQDPGPQCVLAAALGLEAAQPAQAGNTPAALLAALAALARAHPAASCAPFAGLATAPIPLPPHSASDYDTAYARLLADVERLAAAELLVPADRAFAGGGPAAAAAGRRLRLAVPLERAAEALREANLPPLLQAWLNGQAAAAP